VYATFDAPRFKSSLHFCKTYRIREDFDTYTNTHTLEGPLLSLWFSSSEAVVLPSSPLTCVTWR
jgi:hypothetical protein